MTETPEPARAPGDGEVTGLETRSAALRQAARSSGAEPGELLEAALIELEAAVELLKAAELAAAGHAGRPGRGTDTAERQLLRAVFHDAPVPLFLVARDGTVQRVNRSSGDLI
ncbi:MAG: hypothetical protein ACHP9Z_15185, partial [Streptosporangiales bacterium]